MSLLRQLITLAYVDYINYPFNHLILYMGDFVWHIKCIHMWSVASGNYRTLFLADFDFWHFWPIFEFYSPFWPPMSRCNLTWKTVINFVIIEIKFCIFWGYNMSWVAKRDSKIWNMGQKSQKFKISQKYCPAISWGIRPHMDAFDMPNKIPHIED